MGAFRKIYIGNYFKTSRDSIMVSTRDCVSLNPGSIPGLDF